MIRRPRLASSSVWTANPKPVPLIQADAKAAVPVRMLDRVFDNHVMGPMQAIVLDARRPEEARDPYGVTQARTALDMIYAWLDHALAGRQWAAGDAFTLADAAAAPALLYADWAHPIGEDRTTLKAYRARLLARPSFARCVDEAGIGFCLAPRYHPAMRFLGGARKELGIGTTFNFLGPLANPARVKRQALGVGSAEAAERMVQVLAALGHERALVFHSDDGLDELSTVAPSHVFELRDGDAEGGEDAGVLVERGGLVGLAGAFGVLEDDDAVALGPVEGFLAVQLVAVVD